jgi:hypothetical protein
VQAGVFIGRVEGVHLSGRRSTALSDFDENEGDIAIGLSRELDEFVTRKNLRASVVRLLVRVEQPHATVTIFSLTREIGSALQCELASPQRIVAGRIINYCTDSAMEVDCGHVQLWVFRGLIQAQSQCVALCSTAVAQARAVLSQLALPSLHQHMPDASRIRSSAACNRR